MEIQQQERITQKKPEKKAPEDFGFLINAKIDEIETILFTNLTEKEKTEEIKKMVSVAIALPSEKEVLVSIDRILNDIRETYGKTTEKPVEKKITDDAGHFLVDAESGRIPSLHSSSLKTIARENGIESNIPVKSIIQKLQKLRDGESAQQNNEEQILINKTDEIIQKNKENDALLRELWKKRALLRAEILNEKVQTPEGSEESKKSENLQQELLDLEKQIKATEKTNVVKKSEGETKTTEERKKNLPEEILPKNEAVSSVPPEVSEKNFNAKKETELTQNNDQKLGEPYIIQNSDNILSLLKKRFGENEYFKVKLSKREQCFIFDSLMDEVKHTPKGVEINLGAIITENPDVQRFFKKYK